MDSTTQTSPFGFKGKSSSLTICQGQYKMVMKKERKVNTSGKPKHSLDVNRSDGKSGTRTATTVRRLKMYKTKPKRNAKGKILKHELQESDLPNTRIQPDRRWFENTRVVDQKALEHFRQELHNKLSSNYNVILKERMLPMSLLQDHRKNQKLMHKQGLTLVQNMLGQLDEKMIKKEKCEKWMKDTSGSCMLVAALIATVAFTAVFTIPGGNISDCNRRKNDTPVFLEMTSFVVFTLADALALFSSMTSLLMFLALYTSRYAEEEFLTSLPRKLFIGLATLFISRATILVAFSASLSIVLGDRFAWAPIPMTLFSCVPVLLFVSLQLPVFVEIVRSAYWGSLFLKHRYVQPKVDQCNGIKKDN